MVVVVVVGLVGWLVAWWWVVGNNFFLPAGKKIARLFGGHLTYQFCLGRDELTFSPSLLLKGTEKCQAHIFVEVADLSP